MLYISCAKRNILLTLEELEISNFKFHFTVNFESFSMYHDWVFVRLLHYDFKLGLKNVELLISAYRANFLIAMHNWGPHK